MITFQTITLGENKHLEYAVALPADFEPGQAYPVLLALPPGPQTREMVQWGLDNYWADEAIRRGWVVVSPIAPGGVLFFQGSEALIPEFLGVLSTAYQPEGKKFHVAGVSNGGISSFRIAINNVQHIQSLVVLPGFPRGDDFEKVDRLANIPVAMFVGEQDEDWVTNMQNTAQRLSSLGGRVTLEIFAGEGHVIQGLGGGKQLFELLESYR